MTQRGNQRSNPGDPQLHSLERWRTSALEHAQTEHAQRQRVADERAQVVDQVQSTIDASQDLARSHMTAGSVLSVESLTRIRHFATVQSIELQHAAASLEQSKQEAAMAQSQVCKKFEELTVVERLRERRSEQANKESLRKEQRHLDEHALLRTTRSMSDRKMHSDGSD
jgi:flagellar export protein FliJ